MAIWFKTHLRRHAVRANTIQHVTRTILKQAGHPAAQLSLSMVGKTRMQSLNKKYRRKDYPTDVLAFPMANMGKQAGGFLGDLVICLPVAIGQASRFGNTPDQELCRLLIHGTLHLLGYDHERGSQEAARMQRKERLILKKLTPIPRLLA